MDADVKHSATPRKGQSSKVASFEQLRLSDKNMQEYLLNPVNEYLGS